jgi:hypothetical protein
MAEKIFDHALTTSTRVKNRLSITAAGHDAVLLRLCNAASDFIEGQCNRRFLETAYSNEVYSVYGENQKYLLLKQSPVSAVSSLQYRAGTKSNPSWTDFTADNWELLEDGKSGIIRIFEVLPKGNNWIRASYVAGYKFDFANAGDLTKHALPADLTDLCERLVVKWFKRREAEGKTSESFSGGTINWKDEMNSEDKETISRYKRLPVFI